MKPIHLSLPGRDLRAKQRHKIPAHKGDKKFHARYNQAPLVLSRYVGAGSRYEKEPQHPTRPGDKGGEGGATWRVPVYMADFFAQLSGTVGEDGEGGAASSTKRMPDQRAGGSEGPVGAA